MRNVKSMISLALASVFACSSYAAVEGVKYVDPTGTSHDTTLAVSSSNFLNNNGSLTLYISSGLDRRIRLTTSVNNSVLKTEQTSIINIQDEITYNGNTFFGKVITSPVSVDGNYTLLIETLNLSGDVVASETLSYVRDTVAPNPGTLTGSNYSGHTGHKFQPADTWFFTQFVSGTSKAKIKGSGISDANGIQKVELLTYTLSPKTLYKARTLSYDEATGSALFEFTSDWSILPRDDNGETIQGIEFRVTDTAGNQAVTDMQQVIYDTYKTGDLKLVGVYDPDSSATMAGEKGFVPYTSGMTVKTNPIQFMYRVSEDNYVDYKLGGLGFVGHSKVITNRGDGYVYAVYNRPYNFKNSNYIRFNQRGSYSIGNVSYHMLLDESAPKAPSRSGVFQYKYSDIGWSSNSRWDIQTSQLPLRIEGVRQYVGARTYDQVFSHAGYKCTIPAGQTVCEITLPESDKWLLAKGNSGYYHEGSSLQNLDGSLYGDPQWANVTYNDVYAPIINSTTYNAETKLLTVSITQPSAGSWFDRLRLGNVWIEDASKGAFLHKHGDTCTRQSSSYSCEFDLNNLSEGEYSYVVKAQERHGLITTGTETLTYVSDRTAPVIEWGYADEDTVPETISDLRDMKIIISDLSAMKIDELRITGSSFDVNYLLGYSLISSTESDGQGENVYSIELPKLFPTMEENEHYSISVTASDEYGNKSSSSVDVVFIPENLIQLDVQSYLPVTTNLLDENNTPIARIYTDEALVLEGAQKATGEQLAEITVDRNAGGALSFVTSNGVVTIAPGETKEVSIDLGTAGSALNVDVYPAFNEEGKAKFMFSIPQLSSIYNN